MYFLNQRIATKLLIVIACVIFFIAFVECKVPVFTGKEKAAIDKLRAALGDKLTAKHMKSDGYLFKWVKAKNFDDQEARKALQRTLEWRKQIDADNLPNHKFSEDVLKNYVIDFTARDRNGGPVSLTPFGEWDLRRKALEGKLLSDVLLRLDYLEEKAAQLAFNLTGDASSVAVADLNSFSLRKSVCTACLPLYTAWVQHHELHYPYNFYKHLIINAPAIFNPVLNIIRPFMTASTRDAFMVMGYDRAEWSAELGKTVDLDLLPLRYGGTRKTP